MEEILALIFLITGFVFPFMWIFSGCFLPSKNALAKLLGILGILLYSILSLGIVIGILVYLVVFVPWFNLVPQAL